MLQAAAKPTKPIKPKPCDTGKPKRKPSYGNPTKYTPKLGVELRSARKKGATAKELAAHAGVCIVTLYKWVRRYELWQLRERTNSSAHLRAA